MVSSEATLIPSLIVLKPRFSVAAVAMTRTADRLATRARRVGVTAALPSWHCALDIIAVAIACDWVLKHNQTV